MAILRRPRLLRCFYCNQRTSIQYDGHIRQFQCRGCDATNYLDQNGDITDPPASTTAAAATASTFYASPLDPFHDGLGNPDSAGLSSAQSQPQNGGGVFCSTCLKNQHLFVSSLAQYFPSDPNDPEFPELERKYFHFRNGLEQRYPQICADCEPRVLERIRDADYTAKTDHLRRMVQYSRDVRLTQTTPLDVTNQLGRWLWWTGLALQILWQVGVLGSFLLAAAGRSAAIDADADADTAGFEDDAIVGEEAAASQPSPLPALAVPFLVQPILRILAANAGRLQTLCVGATVASCWWNPYLVETVRGFTKPLNGIPTWYAYQAAIVLARFLLTKVGLDTGSLADGALVSALPPTIAGAHVVAALFTLYLYAVAPRAITKDMRPLFGKLPEVPVTPQKQPRATAQQAENRRRGLETLSDVLDEISASPQRTPGSLHGRHNSDTEGWDGWQPAQSQRKPVSASFGSQYVQYGAQYGSQYESTTPSSQPAAYDGDEMDWTPTQTPSRPVAAQFVTPSPHRAFNAYSAGRSPPSQRPPSSSTIGTFNQTPVEASKGPFWYKVPPAPTSIAQRIFNRPNAPRIIDQSVIDTKTTSPSPFLGRSEEQGHALDFAARAQAGASSAVEFAQPSFFAEDLTRKAVGNRGANDDDPGSFLSDLFSQTFSLGQQNGDDAGDETEEDDSSASHALQGAFTFASSNGAPAGASATRSRRRSSVHHRRHAGVSRGQSIMLRLPLLFVTVTSLMGMSWLHDELLLSSGSATTDKTAEPVDQLLFAYVRPYARLMASAAVGLCLVQALSQARASMQGWTRSAVASAVGLVLGVASVVLAAWMAMQMWTLVQPPPPPPPSAIHLSYDDYGWRDEQQQADVLEDGVSAALPWPWWQVVTLHSTVIAHQVWLMLV